VYPAAAGQHPWCPLLLLLLRLVAQVEDCQLQLLLLLLVVVLLHRLLLHPAYHRLLLYQSPPPALPLHLLLQQALPLSRQAAQHRTAQNNRSATALRGYHTARIPVLHVHC
jgi:hypothetical protein